MRFGALPATSRSRESGFKSPKSQTQLTIYQAKRQNRLNPMATIVAQDAAKASVSSPANVSSGKIVVDSQPLAGQPVSARAPFLLHKHDVRTYPYIFAFPAQKHPPHIFHAFISHHCPLAPWVGLGLAAATTISFPSFEAPSHPFC